MLFNSFDFAVFMPVVFLLYWLIFNRRSITVRNLFILVAGYVFYSFWDWRFSFLLFFSSSMDFILGWQIHKTSINSKKRKRFWLVLSVVINLSILGFFKYYNFFVESFVNVFTLFGRPFEYSPLHIILPVGVSFYTFQSLSYIFDVYKGKIKPTKDAISFLAYVGFFPQLVAGPIERASRLLPQFFEKKEFDYQHIRKGVILIALGLFKKIVIADRLAVLVNAVYSDIPAARGLPIIVAVLFFAFQLYLDFSAYSNIARGAGSLLGFDLMVNFRRPYLSKSFSEFWTRWHISLSSWFRDYVYFPLGGNRRGAKRTAINVMIVFLLSGLWHGASWNFVLWGAINGLFLIVFDKILKLEKSSGPKSWISPLFVSVSWAVSLVFFRAQNFVDALMVFREWGFSNKEKLYDFGLNAPELNFAFILILGTIITEWIIERRGEQLSEWFFQRTMPIRWIAYLLLVLSIIYLGSYGSGTDNTFIYFQF